MLKIGKAFEESAMAGKVADFKKAMMGEEGPSEEGESMNPKEPIMMEADGKEYEIDLAAGVIVFGMEPLKGAEEKKVAKALLSAAEGEVKALLEEILGESEDGEPSPDPKKDAWKKATPFKKGEDEDKEEETEEKE